MFGTPVCSTSCSTKGGREPHFFCVFGENKKSRFSLKIRILRCFAFLCCGATRIRTRDTRIFSPLLYQLSYGTIVMSCLICLSECKDIHFFLICKLFRKNYFIFFHHPCNKISYNPIYQQFTVEIKIQKNQQKSPHQF